MLLDKVTLGLLATIALATPDEYERAPNQASKNNEARNGRLVRGGIASAILARGAFIVHRKYKGWRMWTADVNELEQKSGEDLFQECTHAWANMPFDDADYVDGNGMPFSANTRRALQQDADGEELSPEEVALFARVWEGLTYCQQEGVPMGIVLHYRELVRQGKIPPPSEQINLQRLHDGEEAPEDPSRNSIVTQVGRALYNSFAKRPGFLGGAGSGGWFKPVRAFR